MDQKGLQTPSPKEEKIEMGWFKYDIYPPSQRVRDQPKSGRSSFIPGVDFLKEPKRRK